uniref:Uncharacterized protein n=1 Tax=viral metagenome TaxID=1070528 RepID=A0A6M3L057_9ZZZZ
MTNLVSLFTDFRDEQRSFNNGILVRVRDVEMLQGVQAERISNWSIFQTALTAIVGAIATYLGATIKR